MVRGAKRIAAPLLVVPLLLTAPAWTQEHVIDLKFEKPPATDSDETRSLQSLKKIQGTGQFCQDGLYLMTHYGDRQALFAAENQKAIDEPLLKQTWRHCSLFSVTGNDSVIMGRNWDNQTVGSIIVNLYHPPNGYASISITRSIDVGFMQKDLQDHVSMPWGRQLLLSPFWAFDGINEHALAAGVAGVKEVLVKPMPGKELVVVPFLVRKILDQTKTVDEAAKLVEDFVPFDVDKRYLNCHLFVVDASGKSAVLEYSDDHWKVIRSDKAWQVLANKPIYKVPEVTLREQCWRYRSMSEALEKAPGSVDWKAALGILRGVEQKGTTWSAVYSLPTRELHLSVYQDRSRVYHLAGF